jgi:hypothetical protein
MTTLNESFPGADRDFPTTGDLAWSEPGTGQWSIRSNAARIETTGTARADSDLATDDHYVEGVMTFDADSRVGPACRFSASADTCYYGWVRANAASTYRLYRRVAGSDTLLLSVDRPAAVSGSVIRIEVSGSDDPIVKLYDGGEEVLSHTDTDAAAITTGKRGGIWAEIASGKPTVDTWEAADLTVGQIVSPALIDQSGTVFSPQINISVALALITQAGTVFAPQVNLSVVPALIDQAGTVFAPSIARSLALALIDQTGVVFAPTQITQTVTPGLISQAGTVFQPALGAVVEPALLDQSGTVFAPAQITQQVTIALIDQVGVVFAPQVTLRVTVGLIDQAATIFAPTISLAGAPGKGNVALIDMAVSQVVLADMAVGQLSLVDS